MANGVHRRRRPVARAGDPAELRECVREACLEMGVGFTFRLLAALGVKSWAGLSAEKLAERVRVSGVD